MSVLDSLDSLSESELQQSAAPLPQPIASAAAAVVNANVAPPVAGAVLNNNANAGSGGSDGPARAPLSDASRDYLGVQYAVISPSNPPQPNN